MPLTRKTSSSAVFPSKTPSSQATPDILSNSRIRTLIVDDEPVARKVLREELELIDDVAIIGEAENGKDALDQIVALQPNLVLLDLQMPVMGGFEVIRQLKGGNLPVIVIVTAFDQYAIEAFEAGAIDYLLKPVSQARLLRSVERARHLRSSPRNVAESVAQLQEVAEEQPSTKPRKIVGRAGEEYFLLSADEVLAFQSEEDLVWIVTAKRRYLATQTLKTIQEKLQNSSFQRVHRNALVNVNHVRKMSALSSQRWLLTLNNNQEFIVSKRQAHSVRQILSW
jgi:DNA-binding LytR/AlgR family response regulator